MGDTNIVEDKKYTLLRVKVTMDNNILFDATLMKDGAKEEYIFREVRNGVAYPVTKIKIDDITDPIKLAARMIQGSVNFETKKNKMRPEIEAMLNRVLGADADDATRQDAIDASMEILSKEKSRRKIQ